MAVDLELTPKQKRPVGEPCCEPVVYPGVERRQAERMARLPRRSATESAFSSLSPAKARRQGLRLESLRFSTSANRLSPTTSRCSAMAGIVGSEREGLWAYYYVRDETRWRSYRHGSQADSPRASGDFTMTRPLPTPEQVQDAVRERYAAAATRAAQGAHSEARQAEAGCCGTSEGGSCQAEVFGGDLYGDGDAAGATESAVAASLGCGVPHRRCPSRRRRNGSGPRLRRWGGTS